MFKEFGDRIPFCEVAVVVKTVLGFHFGVGALPSSLILVVGLACSLGATGFGILAHG